MPALQRPPDPQALLSRYLDECRACVIEEIRRFLPSRSHPASFLYELMMDYPLREAKGLRPALCIATCQALGGDRSAAMRPAAVLELFHNAFLIHDDIEDESLQRRQFPTLHRTHGVPIAVNVGDAMLALSLQPLLDNVALIGLGPSLRVLEAVARMARESAEGQALELEWIRRKRWDLADADYIHMVEQKTCWYSFVTPVTLGAIAARQDMRHTAQLAQFARFLGIAFQIQDDVLNLSADVHTYGKEIDGDLWEGKRTLILLHMMRSASPEERSEAERILSLPRPSEEPGQASPDGATALDALLNRLFEHGHVTAEEHGLLRRAMAGQSSRQTKTPEQVRFLRELIQRYGSLEYSRDVARKWLEQAEQSFTACSAWLVDSVHRDALQALISFVVERVR